MATLKKLGRIGYLEILWNCEIQILQVGNTGQVVGNLGRQGHNNQITKIFFDFVANTNF